MERTCSSCGRDPGDGASCRYCGAAVYRYAVSDEEWEQTAGADGRLATDDIEVPDIEVELPDAIVPPPDLGFEPAPPVPAYTSPSPRPTPPPAGPVVVAPGPTQQPSSARGCGVAIAVLVLVALVGAGVLVFFTFATSSDSVDVTADPGECLALDAGGGVVSGTDVVPCDDPHDAEAFHRVDLADGSYPGDAAVADRADALCLDEFEAYVGIDYYDSEYWIDWLVPTADGWASGDREVVCLLVSGDGSPLVGSAFGSGR